VPDDNRPFLVDVLFLFLVSFGHFIYDSRLLHFSALLTEKLNMWQPGPPSIRICRVAVFGHWWRH
jgi:hypothetical protein